MRPFFISFRTIRYTSYIGLLAFSVTFAKGTGFENIDSANTIYCLSLSHLTKSALTKAEAAFGVSS